MKKYIKTIAVLFAFFGLTNVASAAFVASGEIDGTDPLWDGCGTGTGCLYDVVEFTVDVSGLYTFDATYADDGTGPMDGILELYEGAFDPAAPGVGAIAFDDDGPGGFTTSQIVDASLTAGTTYFMVVSTWDAAGSFGAADGPWTLDATGPGTVTAIPVPAAVWLFGSALLGLAGYRRRA